jgi:uncharacterized protein (DUF58 family)
VHWRSTAKRGELMVRRDEQPRQNRATLLLDTRTAAHQGTGAGSQGSSFEWAVSACASIAVWLTRRGYVVQLVTTGGVRAAGSTPALAESNILELLAVVTESRESGFRAATSALSSEHAGRTAGLVVALLGVPSDPRLGQLERLPPRPDAGIAVAIDTGSWADKSGGERSVQGVVMRNAMHALGAGGWRVLPARRGDSLPQLWARAPVSGGSVGAASGRSR